MEKKLICVYCYNTLKGEELESPYYDDSGDIICDDCYDNHYMEDCPLCENPYEKVTKAEDCYFLLTKEAIEQKWLTMPDDSLMKAGIYHAKEFPIFFGDILSGFQDFFYDNIELVKEIDINSVLKKLGYNSLGIFGDEICPDCAERYGRKENFVKIRNNYCDKIYNLNFTINERGAIAAGR